MNGRFLALVSVVGMFVTLILPPDETSAQAQTDSSAHAAQEDAIREAVLRYQMEGWASDGDKHEKEAKDLHEKSVAEHLNSKVYFLSVNRKDPRRVHETFRRISAVNQESCSRHADGKVPGMGC
jgi:hypothetical protein